MSARMPPGCACEQLMRATSTPASIMLPRMVRSRLAGPMVATILVCRCRFMTRDLTAGRYQDPLACILIDADMNRPAGQQRASSNGQVLTCEGSTLVPRQDGERAGAIHETIGGIVNFDQAAIMGIHAAWNTRSFHD